MALRILFGSQIRFLLVLAFATQLFAQRSGGSDPAGSLTVTFFEAVGLAIAVETPSGRLYLIDTGERLKDGYYAARDTVAPFLTARRTTEIAGLLISHPHGDHFGGAPYLFSKFKVKALIDGGYEGFPGWEMREYRDIREQYVNSGGKHVVVRARMKLAWDKALEAEVLSPPKGFLTSGKPSVDLHYNDNSLVLRVQHGKNVFLFPGDSGEYEQDHLLRTYPADRLRTTVLAAPHHGNDSYMRFAAATKPRIVVASAGIWGRKATGVFGAIGAKVYVNGFDSTVHVTSKNGWDGTVQVTSNGEDISVETARPRIDGR